jgi:mannosyltransferase
VGLRSLSALLGVALVALVYALGRLLAGRGAGLAAALLAAVNPFQVYYAQEARMYVLLAALGALAFYAALMWAATGPREGVHRWGLLYVLAAAAGLYTHYAFPMALAAVNLVLLLQLLLRARSAGDPGRALWRRLWRWGALQAAALAVFAPWLPTAARQLAQWPRVTESFDLGAALLRTSYIQFVGPARPPVPPLVGWLALLGLVLALLPWRRGTPAGPGPRLGPAVAYLAPVVWFLVPLALIFGLGLYKEAYLKFLLVAAPAVPLLLGRLVVSVAASWERAARPLRFLHALVAFLVVAFALTTSSVALARLYAGHPAYARDDYRSVAGYIDAVGKPGDVILLNAPGQQEVFRYYYTGDLPVVPLPRSRPLDPVQTQAELSSLGEPGGRVFAVLWGTDESDPERFVEGWLNAHAYKALDSWYGNVRLAVFAMPERAPAAPTQVLDVTLRNAETGDEITLWGYSWLDDQLAAGDIAQVTLFWRASQTPLARYKVFVHLLDEGNHIVGQRDAEPGGGTRLTTHWEPGETVADNVGIPIHPATPPGEARVEVGLYRVDTGQRLTTAEGAGQVWLEPIAVERPPAPAPVAALGMQHASGADFGALVLLGYDAHKLGHDEVAPLLPGDVLHVALYWWAAAQPRGDWQVEIHLLDRQQIEWAGIRAAPVGGYPTGQWQAGDVWRGQFHLAVPADTPPGAYRLRIQPMPSLGAPPEPFLTDRLSIGP